MDEEVIVSTVGWTYDRQPCQDRAIDNGSSMETATSGRSRKKFLALEVVQVDDMETDEARSRLSR